MQTALTFDDVLMVPNYSSIESRSEVSIKSKLDNKIELDLPLISAPMDTVTEEEMVLSLHKYGSLGIIHRYNTIDQQSLIVKSCRAKGVKNVGAAIGVTGDYLERAIELIKNGANVICVDVAHGHHKLMKDALSKLRTSFGDELHIMAGNVATKEGFQDLSDWGANSIRVGIGGGSICSTRLQTGFGVPNLSAIFSCTQSEAYQNDKAKIIIDGGIKTSGDMVKAFAAGADFVMCGSILAGTDESPGNVLLKEGEKYKTYRGMASREAQMDWRNKSSSPEGISTTIKCKGSVEQILEDISGNIKSGLSYAGVRDLKSLPGSVTFIQQTSAGQNESFTHILRK